mmetsp:Transcript_17781/g.47340  ORF Transcript_17781/g.47340 Transcript_17781/m.47340 type:complete len:580 (-) Transcript_17781:380-2119(-)
MTGLSIDRLRMRLHSLRGQLLEIIVRDVEVLEALEEVVLVIPFNLGHSLQLLYATDPGTRVAGNVDPRDALLPGELRGPMKDIRFLHTEGAGFDRYIIADQDDFSTLRIFWGTQGALPHDHADPVVAHLLPLDELPPLEHQLLRRDELRGHLVAHRPPHLGQGDAEKSGEVVDVRRARPTGRRPLGAPLLLDGLPQHLNAAAHLLGLHVLERDRRTSECVKCLLEGHGFPAHRTLCHQPQRRRRGRCHPNLDLNLRDPELQNTRARLGHELLDCGPKQHLEIPEVARRGVWDRRKGVEEDLGRRVSVLQHRVEHGPLDEVARGEQIAEDRRGEGVETHGNVRSSSCEHDLRFLVLGYAKVHCKDPAVLQGRNCELCLDLRQLNQRWQCGAHVPILRNLFPAACLVEMQVGWDVTGVRQHNIHHNAAFGIKHRRCRGDHISGPADGTAESDPRLVTVLAAGAGHLRHQNVDLGDLGCSGNLPRLHEGLVSGHVRQNDGVALLGLLLYPRRRKGPCQVQLSSGSLVNDVLGIHRLHVLDSVSTVCPEDVHLHSLASDGLVLIREQGGDKVQAEVHATFGIM